MIYNKNEMEAFRGSLIDAAVELYRNSMDNTNDLKLCFDPETLHISTHEGSGEPEPVWKGHDVCVLTYEGGPESTFLDENFETVYEGVEYLIGTRNTPEQAEKIRNEVAELQNDGMTPYEAYEKVCPEYYHESLEELRDEAIDNEREKIEDRVNEILDGLRNEYGYGKDDRKTSFSEVKEIASKQRAEHKNTETNSNRRSR